MKYQYFTLYDKQTATFSAPFLATSEIEAKRMILLQLQSERGYALRQFANCFVLMKIAEISDEALKPHIPTEEEQMSTSDNVVFAPDVGIFDVDASEIVKPCIKVITPISDAVQMLKLLEKQEDKAND